MMFMEAYIFTSLMKQVSFFYAGVQWLILMMVEWHGQQANK